MNKKMLSIVIIILFLLTTISGVTAYKINIGQLSSDETVLTESGDQAKWTVMAYMTSDIDNNLKEAHIDNFLEMAKVGSNDNVKSIVQLKRADWSRIRRGLVSKDDELNEEWGEIIDGDMDMGNPQTLSTFCNWAKNNYQADKYLLVLAGHGYGSRGCLGLNLSELNSAFNNINNGIDIVTFESCNMGTVEVASAISPYVDYMVASEKSLMTFCLEYGNDNGNGLLNILKNDPSIGTYDLSKKFITNNFFSGFTKSAIDLSEISSLKNKIGLFTDDLLNLLENHEYKEIDNAFESARSFEGKHRDLYHFADLIDVNIQNINSAKSLKNTINNAVIDEKHTQAYSNSYGLSIYMGAYYETYSNETASSFCDDTSWDEFLENYETYENQPPETPDSLSGTTTIQKGNSYPYFVTHTTDPEGDLIYYYFDFGDGTNSGWIGPYESGEGSENGDRISFWHTWNKKGSFEVKVKAKDEGGQESSWSEPHPVTVKGKGTVKSLFRFLSFRSIFSYILTLF